MELADKFRINVDRHTPLDHVLKVSVVNELTMCDRLAASGLRHGVALLRSQHSNVSVVRRRDESSRRFRHFDGLEDVVRAERRKLGRL